MIKKKNTLKKYSQPIYIPHNLYVAANYTKSYIDKLFEFSDGRSIIPEHEELYTATTCYGVREKKTKKRCIVVLLHTEFLNSLKSDKSEAISTISHEAFHVASEILRSSDINLTESSEESYAYLTGWAAMCIF